ncbi:conjugative relaxase domain-containing protein, TrwC/TraI family [Methylobacterium sp. 275MFSha3.1]|uniref:MobF family relaxase n=1 Tax=Methylobacterium sp. 275MFSha3.1 TaxID=1502746 RepID=UPI0008A7B3BF|nr:MobF family relaxase [Methylobacterium sp. 275MFSha3.1]SEI01661.1 conjugative relaxase domain-containing protein, TrwC/TraI family [Methylobacterium sp. 275MFSha3.1]
MVASVAAGTSARYYLAEAEYYLGGREPAGCWLIVGPGLGLKAGSQVEPAPFERLHAALDDQGRPFLAKTGRRDERVGGYDVTFSAPKSVSLLWALADPEMRAAIEQAHEAAVASAIGLLDRNAAFCRRGKGGRIRERVNLTVALFRHGEARPAEHDDGLIFSDAALHHHACVLSLAQREDSTFGALDGKAVFAWKMASGSVYHNELARELERLGFAIEVTGSNGLFEVDGVDRELCAYFSARRNEIEDELGAAGIGSSADAPAFAAAKARATRRAKEPAAEAGEDRHAFWRERAAARGFEPQAVLRAALARGLGKPVLTHGEREALIRARIDAVPLALTQTQSIFEHRHLVAAVATALMGTGAGAERAMVEVDRLVAAGDVVALGRDARWPHPIYSTPQMIAIERELQASAVDLAARSIALGPDSARVEELVQRAGLNLEQSQAARFAATPSVLGIVEGAPGVGKTTLLAPVAQAWREAGWRVIGAASAWKVAHALRDDLAIEARAIDSWLAGADRGRPFLQDQTVLLIDEAGLTGSRQLHRILQEVERAQARGEQVALRLVGDRKQLQPIGGPGLRIVADAIGTRRVDVIVRQRHAWAREAVSHLGAGRAEAALGLFGRHAAIDSYVGPRATTTAMITAWVAARRSDLTAPEPILIARTNSQVLALNAGVREALRGEGRLGAEDAVSLTAVTASGREHQLGLAVGDRLRFLARLDSVGAINGTEAILTGIERHTEGLRLRAWIGAREVSFAPEALADARGRVRLGHAYATTCFGAQGLTTDAALVWVDAGFDRHDAFVAASRARETTRLFVDCIGFDAAVRKERSLSERGRPVTSDERQAVLARVLGRSGEKASTLDYGAQTAERQDQLDLSRSDGGRASPANTLSMPAKTAGQPRRDRQRGKGLALDG